LKADTGEDISAAVPVGTRTRHHPITSAVLLPLSYSRYPKQHFPTARLLSPCHMKQKQKQNNNNKKQQQQQQQQPQTNKKHT